MQHKFFPVEALKQDVAPEGTGFCKLLVVAVFRQKVKLLYDQNVNPRQYQLPLLSLKLTAVIPLTFCRNKEMSLSPCSRALLRTILSSASETSSRRSYFYNDVVDLRDDRIVPVKTEISLK